MGKKPWPRPWQHCPAKRLWELIAAVAVGIILALCVPLWALLVALALVVVFLMFRCC